MPKKLTLILVILALITALFTSCKPDPGTALYDQLQTLYSQKANHFNLATSLTVIIDDQPSAATPLINAWLQILPDEVQFDTGTSVKFNQDQLYIKGAVGFIGDMIPLMTELQGDKDLNFEIFANRGEGIFLRSEDGFTASRRLFPEWTFPETSEWLTIGSASEADELMEAVDRLRDSERNRAVLENNFILTDNQDERDARTYDLEVNMAAVYDYLTAQAHKMDSRPTFRALLAEFFSLADWQTTTTLNTSTLKLSNYHEFSLNTAGTSPRLLSGIREIRGTIWEYNAPLNADTDLFPEGVYE